MPGLHTTLTTWGLACLTLIMLPAGDAYAFEPEEYEEETGASFAFQLNPEEDIYGLSFGHGTWLRGTPVWLIGIGTGF